MFARLISATLLVAATTFPAHAVTTLNYIGQQIVPTGTTAFGTTIGGLSGLDYRASTNSYVAISDDRSQVNPARYYTLNLALTSAAFTGVTFTAMQTLKRPDGSPYPALSIDPEAIRFSGVGNSLYYTSEGDASAGIAPFVREMNADGSYVRDFTVPAYYLPLGGSTGIRNNLAFESLTISNDGTKLLTATENALLQDGPAATETNGTANRILSFDRTTGLPSAEYVYNSDAVAVPPTGGAFATSGLTEFMGLGGSKYLALERSFTAGAPGTGYTIKLYEFDLAGATNVLGIASLVGQTYTSASKTLVLDLATLGIPLDNIEGVTFGKTLENGQRSLILVSDNNFGTTQFTQFIAFGVGAATAVPEPSSWAMIITGFALVGGTVRRRSRGIRARQIV
jgi:hypothetical protein